MRRADPYRVGGRVAEVIGLVVESNGPEVEIGEICSIGDTRRGEPVLAQAVGFRTGRTLLMPLAGMQGIRPGAEVVATGRALHGARRRRACSAACSTASAARSTARARSPADVRHVPVDGKPPSPLGRAADHASACALGVRALDALIPCGRASASASSPAPASASRRCSA